MTKDEIIKLAAKGGPLYSDFDPADTFLFLALRALYSQARSGDLDAEQGKREKTAILRQYESMKLWVRVVKEHQRKEQEFEKAWDDFAKNPTLDNANALHQAWFRAGMKIPVLEENEITEKEIEKE